MTVAIPNIWPAIAGITYVLVMAPGWYWIHTAPSRSASPVKVSETKTTVNPFPPLDTALAQQLETIKHDAESAKQAAEKAQQAVDARAAEIAAVRSDIRALDRNLRCPAAEAPLTPQEIRNAQAALLGQGLSEETSCDGIAGPKFKSSVSAYQMRAKETATGTLTRQQFGSLLTVGPLPSCACPARGTCPGAAPAAVRPPPADCFTSP